MSTKPFFEVHNISFSIHGHKILDQVSFAVQEGEKIALVGRSGAGKSTCLKILGGLLNPDEGHVTFRGKKLIDPRLQLIRGHSEIQLVNQDYQLDLYHNIRENLRIKLLGLSEETKNSLTDEVLEVIQLTNRENQAAHTLSGGEQQRLAIARALIQEPDLLLLDEPFVHLDPHLKYRLEHFIKQKIAHWGGSLILVTHDGKEAMYWADRIIFLEDSRVKRIAPPSDFYWNPTNYNEAIFFGPINRIKLEFGERLFRPNSYKLSKNDGVKIEVLETKFVGTHFEILAVTPNAEEILLYSQKKMHGEIYIIPEYVD